MPSPLPGMNPYLEGPDIWEDFHASLAWEIRAQLAPQLRPRYVAVLVPKVSYEEVVIEQTRIAKPDVAVMRAAPGPLLAEPMTIAAPPLFGRVALEVEVKLLSIEIREVETQELVTAIEILSPINKRPGHEAYDQYLRKRRGLMRSEVHLLEIDLLRGGRRPPLLTPLPQAPYFVFLSRGDYHPRVDIWPVRLQEAIPIVPVPLLAPDPDLPLDLTRAIHTIYDLVAYDLRIDYSQPPPKPDLPPEDAEWLAQQLQAAGLRTRS